MSSVAVSLAVLGAGVAAWPAPQPGRLRLRWLAEHRFGRDAAEPAASDSVLGSKPHQKPAAPTTLLTSGLLAAVLLVVAGTAGPLAALLGGCVAAVCWRVLVVLRSERARRADRADLALAVAAVMDECAAGASLAGALRTSADVAGRWRDDFALAAATVGEGREVAELWRGRPGLAGLGVACSLTATSGAALAPALAAVRDELDAENAVGAAVAEILAGPRSSALLLATLPMLGVALGALMGAEPLRVLLHTGWGEVALTFGVGFDLAGVLWIFRLARKATP